jgi:hypothetical protein
MDLLECIRRVVKGDIDAVARALAADPALAAAAVTLGATRQDPSTFFFKEISHYLYEGDTALHMAAAAFRRPIAELLVRHGADHRVRNRRGAQPLHYAADTNTWNPAAQAETIAYLISIGADPNAANKDGATPLHRAVRTRSAPAVRTLLDGGADPGRQNKNGSTAMDLASRTTGRGGSGSPHARAQQAAIIALLEERSG